MNTGKKPAQEISIATYNIHSCVNVFRRESPEGIARVIAALDPDVVALQEVSFLGRASASMPANQAEWLASRLNMQQYFYPLRPARWGHFGLALLSKRELVKVKTGLLPESDEKLMREVRGAMWYTMDTGREKINIVNTHLALLQMDRRLQIQSLMSGEWLGRVPDDEPAVLLGDLNAGIRSPVYRAASEKFSDVQLHTAKWGYPRPTFISFSPFIRLDHIFISPHWSTMSVKVPFGLSARIASDHLPVCARLRRAASD